MAIMRAVFHDPWREASHAPTQRPDLGLGMVGLYGIAHRPALSSRHTEGRAIDMTLSNYSGKSFADADGDATRVRTAGELHALGASFGVHKLVSDPPHWSDDGH